MLSNKGVGTADQWERGTATRQPITTLLIFWCGRPDPYSFFLADQMGSYFKVSFPFFSVPGIPLALFMRLDNSETILAWKK